MLKIDKNIEMDVNEYVEAARAMADGDSVLMPDHKDASKLCRALEKEHGPQRAGMLIYGCSTGRVPHFFASNEAAMEDLRACAAKSAEPAADSQAASQQ